MNVSNTFFGAQREGAWPLSFPSRQPMLEFPKPVGLRRNSRRALAVFARGLKMRHGLQAFRHGEVLRSIYID
jgi:hypothetical protein